MVAEPEWLQHPQKWPNNPVVQTSPEAEAEAKVIREVLCVSQTEPASDEFDDVLERNSFRQTLRICTWMNRFIHNTRRSDLLLPKKSKQPRNAGLSVCSSLTRRKAITLIPVVD